MAHKPRINRLPVSVPSNVCHENTTAPTETLGDSIEAVEILGAGETTKNEIDGRVRMVPRPKSEAYFMSVFSMRVTPTVNTLNIQTKTQLCQEGNEDFFSVSKCPLLPIFHSRRLREYLT